MVEGDGGGSQPGFTKSDGKIHHFFHGKIHYFYGKSTISMGKSTISMGKSTISMGKSTISWENPLFHGKIHYFYGHGFNSKLLNYQRLDFFWVWR